MKVQCPSCREIVDMVDFLTTSAGLAFTCVNCHESNFLPNPHAPDAPAGEPAPVASDPGERGVADATECPKCGHRQRDSFACHRCGLVFEKFDPGSLPPDPLRAQELWEALQGRGDPDLHEEFLNECLAINRLDFAVRKYRALGNDPAQRTVGERWLKRVAEIGQAQIDPGALSPELRQEGGNTIKIVMWTIVVVGFVFLAYTILKMTDMLGGP